jgi:hypothetical protein
VDGTVAAVEQAFGAALRDGPRATTDAERRALLRYANAAIVAQHRSYAARSWASRDALSVVRAFACECGRRARRRSTCRSGRHRHRHRCGPGPLIIGRCAGRA